jgi:hypothetical protein
MQEPPRPVSNLARWFRLAALSIVAGSGLLVLVVGMRFVPPISGRVIDAATGAPIEGLPVTLEYTRFNGLGPTTTVLYAQTTTDHAGGFRLAPLVGWSGLIFPSIGEHRVTVNHVSQSNGESFGNAEARLLEDPRIPGHGGNAGYFVVTLTFSPRRTCGVMGAWAATCIDAQSWRGISVPLIPVFDEPSRCASVGDSVQQDRCRELNTYRSAFARLYSYDDVQRALATCSNVRMDRIRHACYTQVGVLANADNSRRRTRLDDDPHVATLFPLTIAGERRDHQEYGDGQDGLVSVFYQEWTGREEPPLETREQLHIAPEYSDHLTARVTNEKRRQGVIRMYRGAELTAADWISGNRYVRVFFHERTKKEAAFISCFLDAYPSTMR